MTSPHTPMIAVSAVGSYRYGPLKTALIPTAAFFLFISPFLLFADSDDATTAPTSPLFQTLNGRSKYYQDTFPEPFRVEDTAIDNELRLDWEHDEAKGSTANLETVELEKSVGIFTFELQAPYVTATGAGGDGDDDPAGAGRSRGFGNVELGARLPLYQYVSKSGFFDNSLGFNLEAGVPTNSPVSKNAEAAPGIFDDLALGDHITLQALFTFSHLFGSLPAGRDTFEYGLAFGYAIEDEDFAIPHVERLIPLAELIGETAMDGRSAGHDALTATAGLRAELKSIGKVQPSFGVGYIFPIDKGGREQLRWGIITSLSLEF